MKKMMNLIIIGISSILLSSFTFIEGQFLNVVASSGLQLRISPSTEASMLKVIPFGDQVKVINTNEFAGPTDRINWLDGQWVQVEYQGVRGYVFDGFLSHLPVPDNDFEMIRNDFVIALPLESYVHGKLMDDTITDTISMGDTFNKCVFVDQNGIQLSTTEDEFYYEVEILLPDTRLSEAFNLIYSMGEDQYVKQNILDQAIFIEGKDGKVKEIRINGDASTTIRKAGENDVKIKSIVRYFDGC